MNTIKKILTVLIAGTLVCGWDFGDKLGLDERVNAMVSLVFDADVLDREAGWAKPFFLDEDVAAVVNPAAARGLFEMESAFGVCLSEQARAVCLDDLGTIHRNIGAHDGDGDCLRGSRRC